MSTSTASPSTSTIPTPSQEDQALSLFARSTLDLFHIWPALRLAITHGWGGSSGSQARTHLAEDIVDLFYSTATETASSGNNQGSTSMSEGGVPIPARDEVEATLKWGIGQQFDLDLEDGSEEVIAKDLLALWRECIQVIQSGKSEEEEGALAKKFREGAEKAKREDGTKRFEASRAPGAEDEDTTDEEDSEGFETEEEDTEMGEAPPPPRERLEPIVDEDGFEMVQPKKKGGKR